MGERPPGIEGGPDPDHPSRTFLDEEPGDAPGIRARALPIARFEVSGAKVGEEIGAVHGAQLYDSDRGTRTFSFRTPSPNLSWRTRWPGARPGRKTPAPGWETSPTAGPGRPARGGCGTARGRAAGPGCPPDSAARSTRRAARAASPSRWRSLRTRRRRPRTPSDSRYASNPTRCVPGPAPSSPPGQAPRTPPPRTAPRQPRIQSRSKARTGVMTFRCQPLQVLIEIHPSMEDFDDFERVRFLAQDQEM